MCDNTSTECTVNYTIYKTQGGIINKTQQKHTKNKECLHMYKL